MPIPIKYEIYSKHIEGIPTENKCHLQQLNYLESKPISSLLDMTIVPAFFEKSTFLKKAGKPEKGFLFL